MNNFKIIPEDLQTFFDIAYERHNIYVNKEIHKEPKPWTTDPIFLNYRFCNVFRRLDKVTEALVRYAIRFKNNKNQWKYIIISRFFSKLETIETLSNNHCFVGYDPHKMIRMLKEMSKDGPIMTSGFILNPLQIDGKYYPKLYTPFVIIKDLVEKFGSDEKVDEWLQNTDNLKDIFKVLKTCPSTAGFMAYEYVTDLSYSERYFYNKPVDYYTFGNFTIGSLRGMKRLLGFHPEVKVKINVDELALKILSEWRSLVKNNFNYETIGFESFKGISMREVEHWLCEYDKYMRMKNGEANRLKNKYNGKS